MIMSAQISSRFTLAQSTRVVTEIPEYRSFSLTPDDLSTGNQSTPELRAVGDLNNDGIDDLVIGYYESLVAPLILLGSETGQFIRLDYDTTGATRRHIRNVELADLNADGYLDIVGFTTGDSGEVWAAELGSDEVLDFPQGQVDLILFSQGGTDFESYAPPELRENDWNHGGAVGDVNGDGLVDVLPLSETDISGPLRNIGNQQFEIAGQGYSPILADALKPDMDAGDLNGDGHLDFIFSVVIGESDIRSQNESGTVRIVWGDGDFDFTDNLVDSLGSYRMTETQAREARAIYEQNQLGTPFEFFQGENAGQPLMGPSNLELVDVDGDGLLDILQGQHYAIEGGWLGAGFIYLRNQGNGSFEDLTSEVFPNQEAASYYEAPNYNWPTYPGFIDDFISADVNEDGLDDLVVTCSQGFQQVTYDPVPLDSYAYLFMNEGNGQFLPLSLNAVTDLSFLSNLAAGDFNGDGADDLVGISAFSSDGLATDATELTVFLNQREPYVPPHVPEAMTVVITGSEGEAVEGTARLAIEGANQSYLEVMHTDGVIEQINFPSNLYEVDIGIEDVIVSLRHIVGLSELEGGQLIAADVDQSGSIGISDVISQLRHIVGLESLTTVHAVSEGQKLTQVDQLSGEIDLVVLGDADLSSELIGSLDLV